MARFYTRSLLHHHCVLIKLNYTKFPFLRQILRCALTGFKGRVVFLVVVVELEFYFSFICSVASCSPVDEGIVSAGDFGRLLVRVWILGEVRGVARATNLRDERNRQALLAQLEPVQVLEPAMVLDVIGTVTQTSIPLGYICDEQVLDQTFCILVKIAGELNLTLEDLLVNGHRVIIVERVNTGQHLVGEDAERPPVHGLAVALIKEHFGCQVLRSAAERISARLAVLGKSEVCQFEVALLVDQDVLRLQISVNDIQGMQVLEHQRHLRGVKHGMLLSQFALRSQVGEELTTWNIGHQEVEVARVLREPLQAD